MLTYELSWSDLYPDQNLIATIFLSISIGISYFFSYFFYNLNKSKYRHRSITSLNTRFWLLFNTTIIIFIAECIYNGGIPILQMLSNNGYDYTQFGIPVLHVAYVGYYSAFSVCCFDRYLNNNDRRWLYGTALGLALSILIVNRGAFLITFFSLLLLYLFYRGTIKKAINLVIIVALVFYAFGYLGGKRLESSGYSNESAILIIGKATKDFIDSPIPNEYFWSYLYITSPLANLNNGANYQTSNRAGLSDVIAYQILPDFISKRIYSETEAYQFRPNLITPELNVATFYGRSIGMYGFLGSTILFFWYLIFTIITALFLGKRYFLPGIAILSSMSAMLIFDNMLVFSGCLFQLASIILLGMITKNDKKNYSRSYYI